MIELRATSYTVGSAFNITVAPSKCCQSISQLCNGECFRLITCLPFPTVTSLLPVTITVNGTAYNVLDQFGNTLNSDQIRCRRAYTLVFGTYNPHFMVKTCLPPSQAAPSCVDATSTTTPSTQTVSKGV